MRPGKSLPLMAVSTIIGISSLSTYLLAEKESFSSFYTPLNQCRVIKKETEDSYYLKEKCPGRDGYSVYIEVADARSWLILKNGTSEINLQKESLIGPVNFINISDKPLEWRYVTNQGKKPTLRALIYRMEGVDSEELMSSHDPMKTRSILYVLRLEPNKWCILGKVSSNEEARKLADGNQNCP